MAFGVFLGLRRTCSEVPMVPGEDSKSRANVLTLKPFAKRRFWSYSESYSLQSKVPPRRSAIASLRPRQQGRAVADRVERVL